MRTACLRCRRPEEFCFCARLTPVPSRTRVVLLQHPKEAKLAICSARMTRLSLRNAELHRGVLFGEGSAVREAAAVPGAALLWPGPGAVPAEERAGDPPPVLLAVDGTWTQAAKMVKRNPFLAGLPRIAVRPDGLGGYGDLRREPGPEHLSTLDAVALALAALEREPERFLPMRLLFREVVERQLACARGQRRSPRHRPERQP